MFVTMENTKYTIAKLRNLMQNQINLARHIEHRKDFIACKTNGAMRKELAQQDIDIANDNFGVYNEMRINDTFKGMEKGKLKNGLLEL